MAQDCIVLVSKEAGKTSFQFLANVKKALGTTKVGHTGTLDSFAKGLLVVCAGRLTKLAGNITEFDKTYEAVVKFGEETDTLEYTGNVTKKAPLPKKEGLLSAIEKLTGEYEQLPPEFSAIHVNGKRASDLARQGVQVQMKGRKVTVYSAKLDDVRMTDGNLVEYAKITFSVSKGTYIRSLVRDIAAEAGSCAHLVGLYRTKVGNFKIEDAAGYDKNNDFTIASSINDMILQKNTSENAHTSNSSDLKKEIISKKMDFNEETAKLCGFDIIHTINTDAEVAFKNGKPLRSNLFDTNLHSILNEKSVAVFTQDGFFIGLIYKNAEGRVSYKFVIQ